MAKIVKGGNGGTKRNGRNASSAKTGGTPGSRRVGKGEPSSARSTNGRSEDWAAGCEPLHQRIAELAYILYERSGFQNGRDLEHWLEAERQVKAVHGLAA
jgi:Protein of unknown function (DUF2934)